MNTVRDLICADPIRHAGLYDIPRKAVAWIATEDGPRRSDRTDGRVLVPYLDIPDDAEADRRIAEMLFKAARSHPTIRVRPTSLAGAARLAFGPRRPLHALLMSRTTWLTYFRDRLHARGVFPSMDRRWALAFEALRKLVVAHHATIPAGWVVACRWPEEVGQFTCDGSWGCPWGAFVVQAAVRPLRLS